MSTISFEPDDYDIIRAGIIRSANAVVPDLVDLIHPTSVIDIGCGEGWWLAAFQRAGCAVTGVDGGQGRHLAIDPANFHRIDLSTAPRLPFESKSFDLAISLEVAEHLPSSSAYWLVDELMRLAKVVVFSAAIPGQGGQGHVNEQWQDWWASAFESREYQVGGGLRWRYWDKAPDPIENWYAQNMLLAVEVFELQDRPNLQPLMVGPANRPIPLVHPVLWESRQ